MNFTSNDNNWQALGPSEQFAKDWSKVLIKQHIQINQEIKNITLMLSQSLYCVLQLDAKIKRLIQAVKVHLQLEQTFLNPALKHKYESQHQKQRLDQSYSMLHGACFKINEIISALMLFPHNTVLRAKHTDHIKQFLNEMTTRLAEEDIFYAQLEHVEHAYV